MERSGIGIRMGWDGMGSGGVRWGRVWVVWCGGWAGWVGWEVGRVREKRQPFVMEGKRCVMGDEPYLASD